MMSMVMRASRTQQWAFVAVLLLPWLAACASDEATGTATEIIVELDAESQVGALAASFLVVVEASDGVDGLKKRVQRYEESIKPTGFPKRIAMVPLAGDDKRVFVLTVSALDSKREPLAVARLVSGYVPGEVRYAKLLVEDGCIGVDCNALETCTAASCADARVEPEMLSTDAKKPTLATTLLADAGGMETNGVCSGPNVCDAVNYPCQELGDSYTCRGQFTDFPPPFPVSTFTVNDDGTVLDTQSGLLWQRDLPSSYAGCTGKLIVAGDACTWEEAKAYCADFSLSGMEWRLPTKAELESILDYGGTSPAIDAQAFPDTHGDAFWSSSPDVGSSTERWFVNFGGGSSWYDDPLLAHRVRCVR